MSRDRAWPRGFGGDPDCLKDGMCEKKAGYGDRTGVILVVAQDEEDFLVALRLAAEKVLVCLALQLANVSLTRNEKGKAEEANEESEVRGSGRVVVLLPSVERLEELAVKVRH